MKRATVHQFWGLFVILLFTASCASDLDFDQVNTVKLEPVFVANLAYFNVPAADFVTNGQEQNTVFDTPTAEFFNDKFLKDNLKKVDFFIELENTINRAYVLDVAFLDNANNPVYTTNFSIPAYSGSVNKVSKIDVFENTQLDLLKKTAKIAFLLRMLPGSVLTENSKGNLILRSSLTAYLVVQ